MSSYSVAEAKNTLPRLVNKAMEGETVIITKHGKPVAEIRAVGAKPVIDLEARKAAFEKLRRARESLPPATQTSVELLQELYEDRPW